MNTITSGMGGMIGITAGTGDNAPLNATGANCLLNPKNKLLYNYTQFYRINHGINQGSALGMEAAGAS